MAEAQSSIEVFRNVPLFRGLQDEDLRKIRNLTKEVAFKSGDVIVKEGDAGLGFYVVVEGQAEVRKKNRAITRIAKGGFFGEMALLDDAPRSAEVVAATPTRCLVLLRWNFWSLVSKEKDVARAMLQEMARRLRATSESFSE